MVDTVDGRGDGTVAGTVNTEVVNTVDGKRAERMKGRRNRDGFRC
jgi:hypothetical protein